LTLIDHARRACDQFVVDVIQGGAGTSTNMNANEVIANLALEKLGHAKGDYEELHPLNHVNMPRRAPTTFTRRPSSWPSSSPSRTCWTQ
jgi:aspartate ammonia-lyase